MMFMRWMQALAPVLMTAFIFTVIFCIILLEHIFSCQRTCIIYWYRCRISDRDEDRNNKKDDDEDSLRSCSNAFRS